MYWNNPLIEIHWPSPTQDPVQDSFHQGQHCMFWNPQYGFDHISTLQKLSDLCRWANEWLSQDGVDAFVSDDRNHYDIANLVKLNIWIRDIRKQGIVKPWLILDQGDDTYLAGTGDSRLRCLERIPEIRTVPAFITCHRDRAHLYQGLESITTFDRFGELCGAEPGQFFMFRLTDADAPYGMYWFEYNSNRTRSVTPSEADAVRAFHQYYQLHPEPITPEWFDQTIDWPLPRIGCN